MGPAETIETHDMVAACSGGGGALGHPRVFLNLAPHGRVECPYCSRLYVNPAMVPPATPDDATVPPPRRAPA